MWRAMRFSRGKSTPSSCCSSEKISRNGGSMQRSNDGAYGGGEGGVMVYVAGKDQCMFHSKSLLKSVDSVRYRE